MEDIYYEKIIYTFPGSCNGSVSSGRLRRHPLGGTGSIRGFANMLALSVVCSMFTAIIISRILLMNMINVVPGNPGMFSAKALKKEAQ